MLKELSLLLVVLSLCLTAPVRGVNIIWVSSHGTDDAPSAGAAAAGFTRAPDWQYTDLLKAGGYGVPEAPGADSYNVVRYVATSTPDPAFLNAADVIIVSRSVSSSNFQNFAATAWNQIATPMIILDGYIIRKNRLGFATGSTIVDITGDIRLTVTDPTHPIFAGIPLTNGTMTNPYAGVVRYPDGTVARGISIVTDPAGAEGRVLAKVSAGGDVPAGAMVIAEWPAGAKVRHDGGAGTDVLAGPRLVFLTGAREASGVSPETAGMFDLYEDGARMLANAVALYAPRPKPLYDVTRPGDLVQGVPNNGNWPSNETPSLAIDNSPATKFLHFNGVSGPTGFRVAPPGLSIVTGLTFTAANDVPGRDPIAFELYGSNASLDGPYELIASGPIVDFSQPTSWPRLTKNQTPVQFKNDVAYKYYQILFTGIRGPVGGSVNSMQIAEVELLGTALFAWDPSPADGAIEVEVPLLTWNAEPASMLFDVYLSADPIIDESDFLGTASRTQQQVVLQPATTYYWRVNEVQPNGVRSPGPIWSFTTAGPARGLKGEYFRGRDFNTMVFTRIDPQIDFNLGTGAPDPLVGADLFSIRWTGQVKVTLTEPYIFYTTSDDGVRLWLDGQLLIDNWTDHSRTENSAAVELVAGRTYSIQMEMYENGGDALAQLWWSSPSTPKQLVPAGFLQAEIDGGLVLDDFDSYTDNLRNFWRDGLGDPSNGATVGSLAEGTSVISGKSMQFEYNNTGGILVSNAERFLDGPLNLTPIGNKALRVWVRGATSNGPGLVSIGARDSNGRSAEVYSGDTRALQRPEWTRLTIPLTELAEAARRKAVSLDDMMSLDDVKSLSLSVSNPTVLLRSNLMALQSEDDSCGSAGLVYFDEFAVAIDEMIAAGQSHGWLAGYVRGTKRGGTPIPISGAKVTIEPKEAGSEGSWWVEALDCGFYYVAPPVSTYEVTATADNYVDSEPNSVTVKIGVIRRDFELHAK